MPIFSILLIAFMRTDEYDLIKLINLIVHKCNGKTMSSLDTVEIMY